MRINLKFKDDNHKVAFYEFIKKANVKNGDIERICLFYVLALFSDTRNNINSLYDFKNNSIKPEGLYKGFQTGGSSRGSRLAFNLYNNFRDMNEEDNYFTPLELFDVSDTYRKYMLYAVELRFSNLCLYEEVEE